MTPRADRLGGKSRYRLADALKVACCCLLFTIAARADGDTQTLPVAPYQITLLEPGGPYNGAAYAICYDINNDTPVGSPLVGYLEYEPGDTAVLEATYLANLLNLAGDQKAPVAVQGGIALAIWQIMFPSSNDSNGHPFGPGQYDPAAQQYVARASAAVAVGDWTDYDASFYPTWVPENSAYQRFGVILQSTPPIAPEPGSLALLGTGLLALAWLWHSRTRAARTPTMAVAAQRIVQTLPSLRNTP